MTVRSSPENPPASDAPGALDPGTARRRRDARLRLTQLVVGGLTAHVLFAAIELELFELLARRGPSSAADIAAELQTDEHTTRRLLGALVPIGLLEHHEGRFANGPAAAEFLVAGEGSFLHWVRLHTRWNQTFPQLAQAVRTGAPTEDAAAHLGGSDSYTRDFILAMHDYSVGPGEELARHLDLADRRRLLDVGGGPGSYSLLIAAANPQLHCTVLDLPDVVVIANEVIHRHGLADRVQTHAADYHQDELPAGFDVALLSNVLHQEDPESQLALLRKVHACLEPGGLVAVHGAFLNDDRDGPLWSTLLDLILLQLYEGGRNYSAAETCALLVQAGFRDPVERTMSMLNPGSVITASRP